MYENLFELENLIFGIGTREFTKNERKEHGYLRYHQNYGYMGQNQHQFINISSYNPQFIYDPYQNYPTQYTAYNPYFSYQQQPHNEYHSQHNDTTTE